MTDSTKAAGSDRTDFWTGLILAAVGLAFAIGSWQMPRLEERGINTLTAPGIVPGVLGVALFVLGLVLALRRHDDARSRIGLVGILGSGKERMSLAVAFALNVLFALVLVGRAPFWIATALYLVAFMGIFGMSENTADGTAGARRKRAALILVVTAAVTAGIVYLFETLFFVRLP